MSAQLSPNNAASSSRTPSGASIDPRPCRPVRSEPQNRGQVARPADHRLRTDGATPAPQHHPDRFEALPRTRRPSSSSFGAAPCCRSMTSWAACGRPSQSSAAALFIAAWSAMVSPACPETKSRPQSASASPKPRSATSISPLTDQHRWYSSVLRGHYGYSGVPHNWRSLNGFLQDVRRIWFNCLRRRSQKNRRMGWDWFETVIKGLPLPQPRITHPWTPRTA